MKKTLLLLALVSFIVFTESCKEKTKTTNASNTGIKMLANQKESKAPKIFKSHHRDTMQINDFFTFLVLVDRDTNLEVRYLHNGKDITPTKRHFLKHTPGTIDLGIYPLKTEDAGEYTIHIKNELGSDSITCKLTVIGPPLPIRTR